MKVKIQKNSIRAAAKPKAVIPPIVQERMRYAAGDGGSGSRKWLGVIVIGVILLVIGIAVAAKASHNSCSQDCATAVPVATNSTHSSGYEPQRYDDLGGMTMAEWMKQNNTNNALLRKYSPDDSSRCLKSERRQPRCSS
jgi:hypothetical protein